MLESSLIAPRAAEAALATAIPPPIQDNPVTSAAARYAIPVPTDIEVTGSGKDIYLACKGNSGGNDHGSEKEEGIDAYGCLIPASVFSPIRYTPNGMMMLNTNAAATKICTNVVIMDDLL